MTSLRCQELLYVRQVRTCGASVRPVCHGGGPLWSGRNFRFVGLPGIRQVHEARTNRPGSVPTETTPMQLYPAHFWRRTARTATVRTQTTLTAFPPALTGHRCFRSVLVTPVGRRMAAMTEPSIIPAARVAHGPNPCVFPVLFRSQLALIPQTGLVNNPPRKTFRISPAADAARKSKNYSNNSGEHSQRHKSGKRVDFITKYGKTGRVLPFGNSKSTCGATWAGLRRCPGLSTGPTPSGRRVRDEQHKNL